MKKVLITGANSYIGTSFEAYAQKHYEDKLEIDTIDMKNTDWQSKDFAVYDIVFHVAGIAHADVGKVTDEIKKTAERTQRIVDIMDSNPLVRPLKQLVYNFQK